MGVLTSLGDEFGAAVESDDGMILLRFPSSRDRDAAMADVTDRLTSDLEEVLPGVTVTKKRLSGHTRPGLQISAGDGTTFRVAFKGPSVGGEGLAFENVIFAAILTSLGTFSGTLTQTERDRMFKTFGVDRNNDRQAFAELKAIFRDPSTADLPPSTVSMIARAKVALQAILSHPGLSAYGDIVGASLTGGAGGKADIVLQYSDGAVDISLKHEAGAAGTNVFIFNKDLGDGTQDKSYGRRGIAEWKANLIPSPQSKGPWWSLAREELIRRLKAGRRKNGYSLKPTEERDFITNPRSDLTSTVSNLTAADAEAGGTASEASSTVLRQVLGVLADSFRAMATTPAGKRKLYSLVQESKFGSTSTNPLFKLTSSGSGTKITSVTEPPLPASYGALTVDVTTKGQTVEVTISNKGAVIGSLVIRGVKFRSGIFGSNPSELSIKTRA
jgi:hypothetical protein